MSSGFQTPITIKDAIDKIHKREYLLPAIQRKFTWKAEQIEMLFDSIMRGYPINSFMFWKVSSDKIKSEYKFYEFIKEFREFFAENNPDIDTTRGPNFEAVIDGQQRLTSLYIGLRGSYAYKLPRKRLKDNEECIPTRKLYLNLKKSIKQDCDYQKEYDFSFLSKPELEELNRQDEQFWFEVGDILNLDTHQKINKYMTKNNLIGNDYAMNALVQLFSVIHTEKLINYYLQEDEEADKVLEIFIRTNSGGTPLSFSDLLMSIASANWKLIDARKEIERLIEEVNDIGHAGFKIDKDLVLKIFLFLFNEDIRFKLDNFTHQNIRVFEEHWEGVRKSIISTFELLSKLGFNDKTLRAKNATVPIVYYIYHNGLSGKIERPIYKDSENKRNIGCWLVLSFVKSIFGGQTDSVLKRIRKALKANPGEAFPADKIMNEFKTDPVKNYALDDDFVEGLLESQKDTYDAFYVLYLLYLHLDFSNQDVHQDHLHPAKFFTNDKYFKENIPQEVQDFAKDKKNWNGIANLQLLDGSQNISKNDMPLKDWVVKNNRTNKDLFLSEGTSLELKDFKEFILDRRENLKTLLKQIVIL